MARILSIGLDRNVLDARKRKLRLFGHDVRSSDTRVEALQLAQSGNFDLILLCERFLPAYAAHLADELHLLAPGAAILVLAGRATPLTQKEIMAILSNQIAGSRVA